MCQDCDHQDHAEEPINAAALFGEDLEEGGWDEIEDASIHQRMAEQAKPMPMGGLFKERCAKCAGSGQFRSYSGRSVGSCFACKGKGYKEFRSDPAQRMKARAKAHQQRMIKSLAVADKCQAWIDAYPELHAWIGAKREKFEFAQKMLEVLVQYGEFSEKQQAAIERLCAADKVRQAEWAAKRAAEAAAAPVIEVGAIEVAFAAARAANIKHPKLRLAGFRFSPAPASGKNAGAIYVKDDGGEYLGKIAGGKFQKVYACQPAVAAQVIAVAADPKQAAIAYGKEYGQCACCGRELSNPESVALGIGPICAGRFGW